MCDKSDFQCDRDSDEYTLGHYLFHDHKLNNKNDFDNRCLVSILDISSFKVLDANEHKFIHLMNSLTPLGLNLSSKHPFCPTTIISMNFLTVFHFDLHSFHPTLRYFCKLFRF